MSELKFSCPSCGQHIQCDATHAGENIPCPACALLIRVPENAPVVVKAPPAAAEKPSAPPEESKVSYTPTEHGKESHKETVPTLEENFAEAGNPAPAADTPQAEREHQIAAARASRPVQPATVVKPRLSFVLSGGQAPPREENESAVTPEQREKLNRPSDIKTVKE
jgi:hypothetical protein